MPYTALVDRPWLDSASDTWGFIFLLALGRRRSFPRLVFLIHGHVLRDGARQRIVSYDLRAQYSASGLARLIVREQSLDS